MNGSASKARVLTLIGPFLGLFIVIVFFQVIDPKFVNPNTLVTVLTQTVIVGIGALGMTLVIISGGIDLSVGSVIALTSVVVALFCKELVPDYPTIGPLIAALAGICVGGLCGLINGLLITSLRIVPFIVTLGMMQMARGMAKWLAEEQKIDAPAGWLPALLRKDPDPGWLEFPIGVIILIVLAVIFFLVLRYTVFGRYAFAIGSNESTARLCGIRVPRTKLWIYALGGLAAGVAGVMQFSRLTVGDPTTALGLELDIIAAVVIGGGSLSGGEGSILGSMIGALLLAFLRFGTGFVGWPTYVQEIMIGAIIVAAAALDRLRHKKTD